VVKPLLLKTPDSPVVVPSGVVGPEHLTFLGRFNLPTPSSSPIAYDLNLGDGVLTHRYVDGQLRLFTIGRTFEANGNSDFIEMDFPGVGGTATVLKNWGFIGGNIVIGDNGQRRIFSLLWDEDLGGTGLKGLIITYGSTYTTLNNPFLTVTVFNDDGTVTGYGPWGINGVHSQATKGYVVKCPVDVFEATGYRYWCGSHGTANNGASPFGTYAQLFNLPENFTTAPADTPSGTSPSEQPGYTLPAGPNLDYHDANNRMYRSDDNFELCSWTHYNGSAYGGTDPPDPRWGPANPVQDGSGCNTVGDECGCFIAPKDGQDSHTTPNHFSTIDTIATMAVVAGNVRRGVIPIGQLVKTLPGFDYPGGGTVHECYGPVNQLDGLTHKCPHGQHDGLYGFGTGNFVTSMGNSMWFRSVQDYIDVANGIRTNPRDLVEDYPMETLARAPGVDAFPYYAIGLSPPYNAASTFTPTEKYLLIHHPKQAPGGYGLEMTGAISVFAVDC
jgi:hypothetical protein